MDYAALRSAPQKQSIWGDLDGYGLCGGKVFVLL